MFYHVVTDWDGKDLLPLSRRVGDEEAIELFLARWPDAGQPLAVYHCSLVHMYQTREQAETHQVEFGGEILAIDQDEIEWEQDTLEFAHPVARRVPAFAVSRLN